MSERDEVERGERGVVEARETVEVPVSIPSPEACKVCTAQLVQAVDAVAGVGSVSIDPSTSRLTAEIDPSRLSATGLAEQVERLGFEVARRVGHESWRVTGLDCPDCARTIGVSVSHIDGVLSADLNFASGILLVEYDPAGDPRQDVAELLRAMGYGAEPMGDAAGRPVAEFRLVGLDCPDCAESVRVAVASSPGVLEASIDFATARMRVGYDPRATDVEALGRAIESAGYGVESVTRPGAAGPEERTWWDRHRHDVATLAAGAAIAAGWLLGEFGAPESASIVAYAAAIAAGGSLVARRALVSAKARMLDMNVLMSIAVIGAAGIGEWLEGAMVVFLFSVGGLLEARSLARTRSSIRDLMDLSPEVVRVLRDGEESAVPPTEVVPGETIRVRPGERIALDGVVRAGSSAVDESPITGESVPVEKAPGAEVFAGSLNATSLLEVEVTALASQTTLARVVYLVEEAQAQQAPFQRLVDRFTRYYTPAVVALAIALAVVPPALGAALGAQWGGFSEWFYRALVLLVVSCPCALVIATPVAVVSAITRATRDGVLIKGGAFLELAPRVRAVAFDKTGTLTIGRPEVAEVVTLDGLATHALGAQEVLSLAAAVESYSTHPLARAVVRASGDAPREAVQELEEVAGRGVVGRGAAGDVLVGSAAFARERGVDLDGAVAAIERLEDQGHSALVVARAARAVGVIGLADQIRESSGGAVASLLSGAIKHAVMLTGDNERTAAAIAKAAGVPEHRSRLLPQDKVDEVSRLRERYGAVAMVGDGINDAPALAAADIGIAMGAAGSDTALETADVALMSDDLEALPRFFNLGRRTVNNIWQNVVLSIGVKLAVLVAAAFGVATLWMAVFADTGVALLVILNGLRLLRAR